MDIEYELTETALTTVQSEVIKQSLGSSPAIKKMRNIWLALATVVLVAFLIGYLTDRLSAGFLGVGIIAVVLLLLYAFFLPALLKRGMKKALVKPYKEGPDRIVGKHRVSMTAEGVSDLNENGRLSDSWSDVVYVGVVKDHLLVEARQGKVYIVPETAFAEKAAFMQFAEQAMAYHRAAGAVPEG